MKPNIINSEHQMMRVIYATFRVFLSGREYWVCSDRSSLSGGDYRICRAFPFDTQQDMHDRMDAEGRELTAEEHSAFSKAINKR